MRELTEAEMEETAGGGIVGEMAADWGAVGTIIGYGSRGTIAGATRGGVHGAILGGTYGIAYGVGTEVYNRWQDS